MKMKMKMIFDRMFDLEHVLTPIAIEHIRTTNGAYAFKTYRLVYVFGVRVAYYSTTKFD